MNCQSSANDRALNHNSSWKSTPDEGVFDDEEEVAPELPSVGSALLPWTDVSNIFRWDDVLHHARNAPGLFALEGASCRLASGDSRAVKGQTPLTTLLLTSTNESQIPMLMSGTPELRDMLGARMSMLRRIVGRGMRVWKPLSLPKKRNGEVVDMGEFDVFLQMLWEFQWTKTAFELTPRMRNIFYSERKEAQEGLIDVVDEDMDIDYDGEVEAPAEAVEEPVEGPTGPTAKRRRKSAKTPKAPEAPVPDIDVVGDLGSALDE